MGIASIVLGVLALLVAVGGFLASFVPGPVREYLGTTLSFVAPLLALVGTVLGGVGVSRAREEGSEGGAATAGLIVSLIALFPACFVAIACGMCDAACAGGAGQGTVDPNGSSTPFWMIDAGTSTSPGLGPPPPIDPPPAPDPTMDPAGDPAMDPPPGAPPPAFPPPPLDEPAPSP